MLSPGPSSLSLLQDNDAADESHSSHRLVQCRARSRPLGMLPDRLRTLAISLCHVDVSKSIASRSLRASKAAKPRQSHGMLSLLIFGMA